MRTAFTSLASVAGMALLVPFAILLVGIPVVLGARVLLEGLQWIVAAALAALGL